MEFPVHDVDHAYDFSYEARRLVLSGQLKRERPRMHQQLVEALASGQRIFFAPDDGNLYVERPLDRVFIDPATGNPMGATAL
ncbi:MAG: hypothetical protein H2076_08615 [Planctomycetes bacterium]|nr:hypothetical protein [Planctomycetota bacterium]